MSKNWILIVVIIIVVVIAGGGMFFLLAQKRQTANYQTADNSSLQAPVTQQGKVADTVYQDESGFSFKYPHNMTVKDITPNDDNYYSLVDVRDGTKSIRISVKDGTFKVPTGGSLVGETTLGGIAAKQYTYMQDGSEVLATVVTSQGVLYLIEGPKDGGEWEDIQNVIVASFALGSQQSAQNSAAAGSAGGSVVDEGEEVVE